MVQCLRLGVGLAFIALPSALIVGANLVSIAAAAEINCPPGQVLIPFENRCVGVGAERAIRCPQGEQFDARENRCVRAERATRCPQGEEFDARENRCVRAGPRKRCRVR